MKKKNKTLYLKFLLINVMFAIFMFIVPDMIFPINPDLNPYQNSNRLFIYLTGFLDIIFILYLIILSPFIDRKLFLKNVSPLKIVLPKAIMLIIITVLLLII